METQQQASIFEDIVQARRSVRVYDHSKAYDKDIVKRSLERAILSPNSSNMQLWEFYRVISEEKRTQLAEYCLNQSAAKTAQELVVFVARPDKYKQSIQFNLDLISKRSYFKSEKQKAYHQKYYKKIMPLFYAPDFLYLKSIVKKIIVNLVGLKQPMVREVTAIDKKVTIHKSIALAAQTFMLSVKSEGYDTCPLEGFDSKRIKKLLNLPRKAQINMVISVGNADKEGIWYPRERYNYKEIVKEL